MTTLILIIIFLLGTIIGSFLNVVIFRLNTNLSISRGRSKCFSCNRELEPKDLVPLFSFLMFKGRCRTCKSKISWQYPLVEIGTGIMFVLITYAYFFSNTIFIGNNIFNKGLVLQAFTQLAYIKYLFYIMDLALLSILMCIFVYDFRHKIIPDKLVYSGAALMFIKALISIFIFKADTSTVVWMLLSGPIVALPFALFWVVSGGRWMGLGDAKLALIVGWGLGLGYGYTALMYSFWIGAIAIIGLMLMREMLDAFSTHNNAFGMKIKFLHNKKLEYFRNKLPSYKLRSEIPFGPFMIVAFYMIYFLGRNLLWWI
ncbi:prepilin peptidase [Candidatus Parcubacteria bacterium]|nr:prepilin peptidase [Candidatus Parcubacteria bacterium]